MSAEVFASLTILAHIFGLGVMKQWVYHHHEDEDEDEDEWNLWNENPDLFYPAAPSSSHPLVALLRVSCVCRAWRAAARVAPIGKVTWPHHCWGWEDILFSGLITPERVRSLGPVVLRLSNAKSGLSFQEVIDQMVLLGVSQFCWLPSTEIDQRLREYQESEEATDRESDQEDDPWQLRRLQQMPDFPKACFDYLRLFLGPTLTSLSVSCAGRLCGPDATDFCPEYAGQWPELRNLSVTCSGRLSTFTPVCRPPPIIPFPCLESLTISGVAATAYCIRDILALTPSLKIFHWYSSGSLFAGDESDLPMALTAQLLAYCRNPSHPIRYIFKNRQRMLGSATDLRLDMQWKRQFYSDEFRATFHFGRPTGELRCVQEPLTQPDQ
mmetsp:Transcript_36180/g.82463  ORF Transcript_36180/g.82463 Transcript_36180/m.82463 type:complete len:382 (-) Transcript_36180:92-1237(-)